MQMVTEFARFVQQRDSKEFGQILRSVQLSMEKCPFVVLQIMTGQTE